MKHRKVLWLVGFLGFSSQAFATKSIETAVQEANLRIAKERMAIRPLGADELKSWLSSFLKLKVTRDAREEPMAQLEAGYLPLGIELSPHKTWWSESPNLLILVGNGPVVSIGRNERVHLYDAIVAGKFLFHWTDLYRKIGDIPLIEPSQHAPICDGPGHPCEEPFASELPKMRGAPTLPTSVPVRIREITVQGNPQTGKTEGIQRDALEVEILLKPSNLEDVLDYFSVGWSRADLSARLSNLIGSSASKWVQLQQIFVSFAAVRSNVFSTPEDNAVCHPAAREFFLKERPARIPYLELEASQVLLNDYYCLLPDDENPTFGDYVHIALKHSGRYLFKDPQSGRDLVYSIQGGSFYGRAPYRFWWMDEDFSGYPYARKPVENLRGKWVDVWRRCKR